MNRDVNGNTPLHIALKGAWHHSPGKLFVHLVLK